MRSMNRCIVIHIKIFITKEVFCESKPQVNIQSMKVFFRAYVAIHYTKRTNAKICTYLIMQFIFGNSPRGNTVQQPESVTSPDINHTANDNLTFTENNLVTVIFNVQFN